VPRFTVSVLLVKTESCYQSTQPRLIHQRSQFRVVTHRLYHSKVCVVCIIYYNLFVCVCVCACVHACVHACVRVFMPLRYFETCMHLICFSSLRQLIKVTGLFILFSLGILNIPFSNLMQNMLHKSQKLSFSRSCGLT